MNKTLLLKILLLAAAMAGVDAIAFTYSAFYIKYDRLLLLCAPFFIYNTGVFARRIPLRIIGDLSVAVYLAWVLQYAATRNESMSDLALAAALVFAVGGLTVAYLAALAAVGIMDAVKKKKGKK